MIKYAFYIRPDDIYNVLLILRDANAKWAGRYGYADFMEESEDIIKSRGYDKKGMALYINGDVANKHIVLRHSGVQYLNDNAESISNQGYNILDNFYLIPEFSGFIQYDELETNDTNFFDI